MLESCVAPILILLIGMFYQKREQVCPFVTTMHYPLSLWKGSSDILVLRHERPDDDFRLLVFTYRLVEVPIRLTAT
jgi:hypothetical protein